MRSPERFAEGNGHPDSQFQCQSFGVLYAHHSLVLSSRLLNLCSRRFASMTIKTQVALPLVHIQNKAWSTYTRATCLHSVLQS